jgi:hypothetical protein
MKRINVKLLVILAVGALFLVVGVHLLHAFQIDRNAGILLEQAKTARKEGDLREAFKRYHQYLKHRDDPDAMAAFSQRLGLPGLAPWGHRRRFSLGRAGPAALHG